MRTLDDFIAFLLDILFWAFIVSIAISILVAAATLVAGETEYLAMSIGGFLGSGIGFCVAVIANHTHAREREYASERGYARERGAA